MAMPSPTRLRMPWAAPLPVTGLPNTTRSSRRGTPAAGLRKTSRRPTIPPEVRTSETMPNIGCSRPIFRWGFSNLRTETPLSAEATEGTIYLRNNECGGSGRPHCGEVGQSLYQPLVTDSNIYPPGIQFGFKNQGISYEGASPNLDHVVLRSRAPLTGETEHIVGSREKLLYEWSAGELALASQMPNPGETLPSPELGHRENVRHAVSSDGSRVFWGWEEFSERHLYMRDAATATTIPVDAAEPGAAGGIAEATFQIASTDGSEVFFTDTARLTHDSSAHGGSGKENEPDLYEFDTENDKLIDLTVDPNPGEHADVLGTVIGAGEDGSYVYFIASGVLTTKENDEHEKAAPRGYNLYMLHYDSGTQEWEEPFFIAGLSSEDGPDWEVESGSSNDDLGRLTARVSPDGRYLAFMSDLSLTKYDNLDANNDAADEEVYLYDAQSHRLVCASCNPTGAHPTGVFDNTIVGIELLVDEVHIWKRRWLAASIPGWDGNASTGEVAQYQPRYLSDSGRLFFDSADALVPQDSNGLEDVYEYEPEGVGGCTSATSSGSWVFVGEEDDSPVDGCIGLISSGTSRKESAFLDASDSGDDIFFLTTAQLVPQDTDTAYDVYDAHVCSEAVPCLSTPVSPPPCTTEEWCKAAPAPQPAIYGAPSSATFTGAGNPAPTTFRPTVQKAKKRAKAKRVKVERRRRKRMVGKKSARPPTETTR